MSGSTSSDSLVLGLPHSPLLTSQALSWDGIWVEYHRQPPHEFEPHGYADRIITIHLGAATTLDRILHRQVFQEQLTFGDIGICPGEIFTSGYCYDPADFLVIQLNPQRLTQAIGGDISETTVELIPQFKVQDLLIQGIGMALKTELESGGATGRLYTESLINALVLHLYHHYSQQKSVQPDGRNGLSKPQIQQAIDYLHAHLNKNISLQDLAQMLSLSQYHFARQFKQSTGYSPYQYLIHCRIERVKQLLLQPHLSITEIASQVGFVNSSQFATFFRKRTGVTPTTYRQQLR